ncbi:MAG: 16S rRNA (guanine(966)-N(2))-methyltransferase RsmD [Halocynthiibacter sp.]
MRIVAGQFRGKTLTDVGQGDARAHLRPTTDRVRENLFNVLLGGRYGNPIAGKRVLDVYAGTGALGLEALSRGATEVGFVENGSVARGLLKKNIALLGVTSQVAVIDADALLLPPSSTGGYDLIFMDPPYGKRMGGQALRRLIDGGWLNDAAVIVWEDRDQKIAPVGFEKTDNRKYGDTHITILKKR